MSDYEDLYLMWALSVPTCTSKHTGHKPKEIQLQQNGKLIKLVLDSTFQSFWCYLTKWETEDKGNKMDFLQVEYSSGLQKRCPDFKLYTCFLSLWPEIHQTIKKVIEGVFHKTLLICSLAVYIRTASTDYVNGHKNPTLCQHAFYTVAFKSQFQSYAGC